VFIDAYGYEKTNYVKSQNSLANSNTLWKGHNGIRACPRQPCNAVQDPK